jgi:hypothetical protein
MFMHILTSHVDDQKRTLSAFMSGGANAEAAAAAEASAAAGGASATNNDDDDDDDSAASSATMTSDQRAEMIAQFADLLLPNPLYKNRPLLLRLLAATDWDMTGAFALVNQHAFWHEHIVPAIVASPAAELVGPPSVTYRRRSSSTSSAVDDAVPLTAAHVDVAEMLKTLRAAASISASRWARACEVDKEKKKTGAMRANEKAASPPAIQLLEAYAMRLGAAILAELSNCDSGGGGCGGGGRNGSVEAQASLVFDLTSQHRGGGGGVGGSGDNALRLSTADGAMPKGGAAPATATAAAAAVAASPRQLRVITGAVVSHLQVFFVGCAIARFFCCVVSSCTCVHKSHDCNATALNPTAGNDCANVCAPFCLHLSPSLGACRLVHILLFRVAAVVADVAAGAGRAADLRARANRRDIRAQRPGARSSAVRVVRGAHA